MWLILYLCWAGLGLSCANQEAGPSMTVNKHAHGLDSASVLPPAPQQALPHKQELRRRCSREGRSCLMVWLGIRGACGRKYKKTELFSFSGAWLMLLA